MMQLSDVMSRRVVTIPEARTVRQAARVMERNGIGSVIVTRKGKPVGIVTERDILGLVGRGRDPDRTKASAIMSTPLIVGSEKADLQDAVRVMVAHDIKKLPVIRGRRLVGIVTTTDFARIAPLFNEMMEKALHEAKARRRPKGEPYRVERGPPTDMYG